MRLFTPLICLLCVTACVEKRPVGPTVVLNQRFELAPGEAAVVASSDIRIQFSTVSGDSRCPAGVLCIQGGDAVVRILVTGGGVSAASYDLHTGDSSKAAATHASVRISLVDLQPYPFSSGTIAPQDYRATFLVTMQA